MMIIFLLFLVANFLFLVKAKSLSFIFVSVHLISVIGTFFLGKALEIKSLEDYAYVLLILLILYLIILPWKFYYNINTILPFRKSKLDAITRFLIVVNSISFVILLIVTIIVQSTVDNINDFKYNAGVNDSFIANNLPFPRSFFSLAIILSYFSYFILPLHFYYLHKNNNKLAIICLILSFNIMLIGLTYFSRAVVVNYLLLYVTLLYMFRGAFSIKTKRLIKRAFILIGCAIGVYFIKVSIQRFDDDRANAQAYRETIPASAITKDPLLYSFIDYLSQGYINGFEIVQRYEGDGFNGKLTFEKVNSLISSPYETKLRLQYRQKLWPVHYSYSFLGLPAHIIYDYGIIGGVLFCLGYYCVVRKFRPVNGTVNLKHMFLLVFLIQVPLMGIFYNVIGEFIIALLLWIPLIIYLNYKLN